MLCARVLVFLVQPVKGDKPVDLAKDFVYRGGVPPFEGGASEEAAQGALEGLGPVAGDQAELAQGRGDVGVHGFDLFEGGEVEAGGLRRMVFRLVEFVTEDEHSLGEVEGGIGVGGGDLGDHPAELEFVVGEAVFLPAEDEGAFLDIDAPEEYERLLGWV